MPPSRLAVVALACALALPAAAQAPGRLRAVAVSDSLATLATDAYRAGRFAEAGPLYAAAVDGALAAGTPTLWYNAACSYALAGDSARAVDALARSVEAGWEDVALTLRDTDLTSIHDSAAWPDLVARTEANDAARRERQSDPDRVRIVTEDIARFWAAYDVAAQDTARAARAAAFERLYLAPGTEGLLSYVATKIGSADVLARRVARMPRYYAAVRPQTLALDAAEADVRAGMRRLLDLYPEATFPDVYFVVGALTSGGTSLSQGLLLGVEMNATTEETPMDEIGAMSRVVGRAEDLPLIAVHELVHANQNMGGAPSLLRNVLIEGGADFLSELALGSTREPFYRTWGRAHERQVWDRFMAEKDAPDWSDWTGTAGMDRGDWVGDLGYYVGYEIARGYYERATDTRQAVRDLLTLEDPAAILAASGYADRFAADG